MSMTAGFDDPYAQPGSAVGDTEIDAASPPGSDVILHDDGSATLNGLEPQQQMPDPNDHFANMALVLDPGRLSKIASDFLQAIEVDRQSRSKRDKQYQKGLQRTGLGDDAPGGATFPGASRVVHPMLTEAAIDFGARVLPEMFPPDGPCKSKVIGESTMEKDDRAHRTSRYINLQLTELIPNVYHEFDVGFGQCSLGGAFYTKMQWSKDEGVTVTQISIDKLLRPWNDGSIYDQPRITHEMDVTRYEYESNVESGMWADVLDPYSATEIITQTAPTVSNDKITGRTQPIRNIDDNRMILESSILMSIQEDGPIEPCILTVDEQTTKVLGLYRNWKQEDPRKRRLMYVVEWPFWPWRGGVPIGMAHMIGGLSGASTGALRALLDAAHLNNSQTGVYLKGGATSGGQNIRAQPMQTTTLNGSLAQDDVRKTYMPLPFREPSGVLFQLLGFLVDAGKGVVRTTFDEFDKFNGQTPVGTANMFIEQGLKNLGAIHRRMHRSMRLFLRQLWDINADTLDTAQVVDQFGELIVSKEDFAGPMAIVPVSDPDIFSDMQRQTLAQLIVQRANDPIAGQLYNKHTAELYFLRQMKAPDPEKFLITSPQPVQQNAIAENVTASRGLPIQVYPGQDHEAHLASHIVYLQSPLFGMNSIIATKFLPIMLQHLADHIALYYSDAMLDAANAILRKKTGNDNLTIESFKGTQYEAPLDRLLAELSPEILNHASKVLAKLPQIIAQAQTMMQRLAPPMQMDPSVVAMHDVNRQKDADENNARLKLVDSSNRKEADQRRDELAGRQQELDASAKEKELGLKQDELNLKATDVHNRVDIASEANNSREQIAEEGNQTKIDVAHIDTDAAMHIAEESAKAHKATRMRDGASLK